jgi:hypothetical protein
MPPKQRKIFSLLNLVHFKRTNKDIGPCRKCQAAEKRQRIRGAVIAASISAGNALAMGRADVVAFRFAYAWTFLKAPELEHVAQCLARGIQMLRWPTHGRDARVNSFNRRRCGRW